MAITASKSSKKNIVLLIIVILLAVNTLLIGWTYYSFRLSFPSSASRLGNKQEVARDLADYSRRLATELDVLNRPAVTEALAVFNYDVEVASSSDELTQVILNQGRRIQEIILREAEAKLIDQFTAVINQDQNIAKILEKTHLTLNVSEDDVTTAPANMLLESTIDRLREIIPHGRLDGEHSIELEISDGTARVAVSYNPVEHMQALTEEIDSLRLRMHEVRASAGQAELSGSGIIVYIYDELNGITTNSIIHDADIRDVVNELFGSGAQGISVGGQRLTVTSAIRCSGSLIKVNDKLITVNPVIIEAVGDADILRSGLDIISNNMRIKRGIRFEVVPAEDIKLPAYAR